MAQRNILPHHTGGPPPSANGPTPPPGMNRNNPGSSLVSNRPDFGHEQPHRPPFQQQQQESPFPPTPQDQQQHWRDVEQQQHSRIQQSSSFPTANNVNPNHPGSSSSPPSTGGGLSTGNSRQGFPGNHPGINSNSGGFGVFGNSGPPRPGMTPNASAQNSRLPGQPNISNGLPGSGGNFQSPGTSMSSSGTPNGPGLHSVLGRSQNIPSGSLLQGGGMDPRHEVGTSVVHSGGPNSLTMRSNDTGPGVSYESQQRGVHDSAMGRGDNLIPGVVNNESSDGSPRPNSAGAWNKTGRNLDHENPAFTPGNPNMKGTSSASQRLSEDQQQRFAEQRHGMFPKQPSPPNNSNDGRFSAEEMHRQQNQKGDTISPNMDQRLMNAGANQRNPMMEQQHGVPAGMQLQHRSPFPPQSNPNQHPGVPHPQEVGHAQQQLGGNAPPEIPGVPAGGMRELRVEDALLYLDDVKRQFRDSPAIYNEFLCIMKNFKSQEVDTPGVIARVSKLFRGYNKLILGFNTFLPDGYKISLADLERAEAERAEKEREERLAEERAIKQQQQQLQQQQQQQQQQRQQQPTTKGKKKNASGTKRGAPKPGPAHFSAQAQEFQQRGPGRPPAETHEKSLGQGRPLGSLSSHEAEANNSADAFAKTATEKSIRDSAVAPPTSHQAPQSQASWDRDAQQQQQQQQQQQFPPKKAPGGQPPRGPVPAAHPPPQQHQAVEFDHAISYVTTIKKRFANDPSTYHSFLEILHTYQKEQRGIKEVLEQVAHLFQDHPDLLKEFTFFLPDAVQEQAKERLHRAAAESESRQREREKQKHAPPGSERQLIDMTRSQMPAPEERERGNERPTDGQPVPSAVMPQQPDTFVYNSAVERQFFDSAREALSSFSRDGGQAWAEFLKCLDMFAQEILSRSEMLAFVEPLLGKRNNGLFEEFKRILTAAGSPDISTQAMEDSWYSVPLAEIDFSRCRRCSPSYRALPRDYPAHPCSGRSESEAKVINDIWVSLPVGSEESYTFRHMRRNTYEETLFRVEDERFEIDMVIDSNAATLQRLKPIAEEIALLAQEDYIPSDLVAKEKSDGAGLGGKRFQYAFDKNILGVIHRNTIARIYGDSGQEMLDLMVKNPTVAIPLVVQRLRQKNREWLEVRDRLNTQWKELAEHNYYRSLDHRSLTWRTIDKRAISNRTLIAEIKDRAANRGRESKEALQQKLEKAKEEHGTFYEITVGDNLSQGLDLTFLPKPDRRLFTPHLSLLYKNVSWAQRDAYRILAFALERGPISPADKERCHRLWVEFLGPWFDLSLNWMQKPAVTYQESTSNVAPASTVRHIPGTPASEDEDESLGEDPEIVAHMVTEELQEDGKDRELTDHHPLPAGAHVSTLYGEGKVLEFRRSDHIYAVKLGFGAMGYLRPATVLCSMLPVEKSAYTRQLRADDRTRLARPNDQLAFGTQSLYLFFRLHQILVDRLNTAKRLAFSVVDDPSLQSMVEQMPNVNPKAVGRRRYEAYLSLVYALLDGGVSGAAEGGKYEDRVRGLLGHGAYELATMDKLISHIWKDIQTMANDETMWNLVQLYRRHLLAGSFQPEAFRQEAAYLSDGEPMFAFQHCPIAGSDDSVLHMEYLGIMDDEEDQDMEEEEDAIVEPSQKRPRR